MGVVAGSNLRTNTNLSTQWAAHGRCDPDQPERAIGAAAPAATPIAPAGRTRPLSGRHDLVVRRIPEQAEEEPVDERRTPRP